MLALVSDEASADRVCLHESGEVVTLYQEAV